MKQIDGVSHCTGEELKGRRLITVKDVSIVLSHLQTTSGVQDAEDDSDALTAAEIEELCSNHEELKRLSMNSCVKKMQQAVPEMQISLEESSHHSEDENETDSRVDFFTPTAVEDIFATLSDLGQGVQIHKKDEPEEEDDDLTKIEDRPEQMSMDKPISQVQQSSLFAGVELSMPMCDCLRLQQIMDECKENSAETISEIEEQLAFEKWEAEKMKNFEVGYPNRNFLGSDIDLYPCLIGSTGSTGLPWDVAPLLMSVSDGNPFPEIPTKMRGINILMIQLNRSDRITFLSYCLTVIYTAAAAAAVVVKFMLFFANQSSFLQVVG